MEILKQFKKSVASLALVAMSFTFVAPVAQAQLGFTDDAEVPSWAVEAIEELMDQGVISGNDDGSFAPNRQLNRAEVSKIIVLATGIDLDVTGGPHFPDVEEGVWYYDYIETMYNQGWINGYPDGYFRPDRGINRVEIAKMVVNAFEIDQDTSGAPHFDDVTASDWFYSYVETAYNYGLMRGYGDGTFGPADPVTRAQTVKIVYDSQLVVAPVVGPAEGTLEVALSADTPRGTNIPFNATSVPFTTVELTASDDSDVEVSSLTYTRLGLGDNDDFDNVWLEIDGFKVGNDKSINNDDIVELRFNPPIVVPAGQTLVADIVTSLKYVDPSDKNVGHHNRLAVVSADDIVSTAANVVGDFPIEGEEMEVADYKVSELSFSILGSDTTIDVGDNFIEIGKFRLLNQSTTNKDIEMRAITFKNDGIAELEDVLENVALYVSGEQVSAESIIDGDYITFRLDNGVTGGYIVEDGDSRIFSIRADIVSAEKNDTISFKVDNFEDIVGVEVGTSFGVKAVYGSGAAAGASCTASTSKAEDACALLKTYTIDSGDLNVSRDPSSLGNQEYSPGSNDVVLMTARIIVDQPLLVDGVTFYVDPNSTVADKDGAGGADQVADFNLAFDNFRLFLNDSLVDSENDFTGTGACTTTGACALAFDTTFEIAGTSIMKMVANVQDIADDGDKLKLTLSAGDFASPEYISTGDQVVASQLLGSASGSFVEVKLSKLDITRTDGFGSGQKLVAGVDDVTFMKFVLDNNDSGDVNVTSVSIAGAATGNARTTTNFTAAVFVDGTQQGSAKNLDTNGKATFNDLSVSIPSAGQKEFVVVLDTIEASAAALTATVRADVAAFANDGTSTNAVPVTAAVAAGATVGDTFTITEAGVNGGDPYEFVLSAVSTAAGAETISFVDGSDGALDYSAAAVVALKHTLQISVTDVDADNVENGKSIVTYNGGTAVDVSAGTGALAGTSFELVSSGTLTVALGSTVFSDILIANSDDVEVMQIRFNAADDEVQIKDIYLENDTNNDETADNAGATEINGRVDFKLYSESGDLIQTKQMDSTGKLHFDLANQDRIRVPKDDSTYVTVKVDVRDITKAVETGKRLALSLDNNVTGGSRGIEAVTAATGDDITAPAASPYWEDAAGNVTGQDFVAYRTSVEVRHASTQPNFQDPSPAEQEVYRFTITADSARQAEVGRVTLDTALSGMKWSDDTSGAPLINAGLLAAGSTTLTVDTVDATTVFSAGDIIVVGGDVVTTVASVTNATTVVVAALPAAIADNDPVVVLPISVKQVKSDGTIDNTATVTSSITAAGSAKNSATLTVNFANQKLTNGESRTYALFVGKTVQDGTSADDDSVSVTIKTDTAYAAPSNKAGKSASVLIWSDESSASHSDTTLDWLNGYLVDIDTTAQVNAD